MTEIHPTAIIDKKAEISEDVRIGPYTVIGKNVHIGKNCVIYDHVHLEGITRIGENNIIYPFVTFGTPPQDLSYNQEENRLEINNNNIFRAHVHINTGSKKGGGVTSIGSNNYFMVFSHVGHDCKIGNNIIFTNNTAVGGHSIVEDFANLSFAVGIHQFTKVGAYCMIGGGAQIIQDVPPYSTVVGSRPSIIAGVNTIGLRRHGFSKNQISNIRKAFKLLFWSDLNTKDAIKQIKSTLEIDDKISHLLDFIESSERGIIKKTAGQKRNS
ncbi:MAG: acyl-ACP--UDP-N-acetylglucosamine O-acyltransferase [Candidatus Aminicenantaceae bacterium]